MSGRWARRLAGVFGWGPVVLARAVLARYGAAGGSLLAGGLAYSALFALVPLVALVTGILGLIVTDFSRREEIVGAIAEAFPPLKEVVQATLDEFAHAAGAMSVLGAAVLAWGASRFGVAFQDAMQRIFGGEETRGIVVRNAAALVAVVALSAVAALGALLAGFAAFLDLAAEQGWFGVSLVVGPLLTLIPPVSGVLSLGLAYRLVPAGKPKWRAIAIPAVVVGLVLTILTRAFVFVAPRLVGSAASIGSLATAFAALAWLGLSFQAILLGAAWVRERDPALGD